MNAERLSGPGVRRLVVCLDNDPKADGSWPGREGALSIARLVALRANVRNGNVGDNVPVTDVVPPFLLGSSKDADAYVRSRSLDEFRELPGERQSAARFVAEEVLGDVSPASKDAARRQALEQVFEMDAQLSGPRAALHREEVRVLVARKTGYSPEASDELARNCETNRRRSALEAWRRGGARGRSKRCGRVGNVAGVLRGRAKRDAPGKAGDARAVFHRAFG